MDSPGLIHLSIMTTVTEHDQLSSHKYIIHFPDHAPRTSDPHYKDFNHYHSAHRATARCAIGVYSGYSECRDEHGVPTGLVNGYQPGLELHHSHIEFSLQNAVDLKALEIDYPGVSNPDEVGAWVESETNFTWLCAYHHRSTANGIHAVSASDFEASKYVRGLLSSVTNNV